MRSRKPSSPTWKTFLINYVQDLMSLDFFVVPTVTHTLLFVLVSLAHERRRIVRVHVTEQPTAEWTAQQVVEAFPRDEAPRYLLSDRDRIFGPSFRRRVRNMGIEEVLIAPQSPYQNLYVERVINSIRRDMLDRVIVLSERHLRRLLTQDTAYDHQFRTHLSLAMDCPESRPLGPPETGDVISTPEIGGLPHHYERRAA